MNQELKKYRQMIDEIDQKVLELLAKRFEVVKDIGQWKKIHQLPPLDQARWQEIIKDRLDKGEKLGLDENFIKDFYNRIHQETIKIET